MRATVAEILNREVRVSSAGKTYTRTHLLTEDGTEATYYGVDIELGDKIIVFHDDKWNTVKAIKA